MRICGNPLHWSLVRDNPAFGLIRVLAFGLSLAGLSRPALAQTNLTLAWPGSSAAGVIGYRLYQGGASGAYTNTSDVGNRTSGAADNLTAGGTYFFAVTAYNFVGLESSFSSEFVYTVPFIPGSSGSTNGVGPLTGGPASYYGLFYEPNQVRQASSGSFTLARTKGAAYSGHLQLGGARLAFHGLFDPQGHASNSLPRRGASPLSLQFLLAAGPKAEQVQGTVSAEGWQAGLVADRQGFNAHSNPAPLRGAYTLVIPGESETNPALPMGHSFGVVRIDAGGQVHLMATLADGTRFTQSAPLPAEGLWGLYAPLYAGQGSVLSWLAFTNRPTDDFNGALSWIKPANPQSRMYPAGFTNDCDALGSTYVPPSLARALPLSLTQATLNFAGGDLAEAFSASLTKSLSGQLRAAGENRLSLAFSPSTGAFHGSVTDPSSGKPMPFGGVVFQRADAGFGFLSGKDQSSWVELRP